MMMKTVEKTDEQLDAMIYRVMAGVVVFGVSVVIWFHHFG